MTFLIVENGIIANIIVSDADFAAEIGALPYYEGAVMGAVYAPPAPPPTPEEDRDELLVDLDYRLTLVELGVM